MFGTARTQGCDCRFTRAVVWLAVVAGWVALPVHSRAQEDVLQPVPPEAVTPAEPPAAPTSPAPAPSEAAAPTLEWPSVDPIKPPPAPPGYAPTRWSDAEHVALDVAQGSMELCDVVTLPLGLIPQIGFFLELAADAACIVPGAYGVDHVNAMHGERNGHIWQAFTGLALSKAWRDLTRWPVFIALGVGALGAAALATGVAVALSFTVFPFAFLYLPVAFAGILATVGLSYIVIRKVRKSVAEGIFFLVHRSTTPVFKDAEAQRVRQNSMVTRPPFNLPTRAWALGVVAAGVDGDSSMAHLVPVVGPVIKAYHKDQALKDVLRRVSKDEFREGERSFTAMDVMITLTCVSEGVLGALAHAGLWGGMALFMGGTAFAAWNFQRNQQALPYVLVATTAGAVGMASAGAGLLFLGGRELARVIQPLAIPLAFGIFPDGEWFPKAEPITAPMKPAE